MVKLNKLFRALTREGARAIKFTSGTGAQARS